MKPALTLFSCFLIFLTASSQVLKLVDQVKLVHMGNIPPKDPSGKTLVLFGEETTGIIWVTDGTPEASKPLAVNVKQVPYTKCVLLANKLCFVGVNGLGEELWITDGTVQGTKLVKDINPGAVSASPFNLFVFNNRLFFYASSPGYGSEPWISDGTEAGTGLLADMTPGPAYSTGEFFAVLQGELFFFRYHTIAMFRTELELWKTNGTAAGTKRVAYLGIFGKYFSPAFLTNYNYKLYFLGVDANNQAPLFVSDGTEAGTHKADLDILYYDATTTTPPQVFNNKMFLKFPDMAGKESLYVSDGTKVGTKLLDNDRPNGFASIVGNNLLYEALDTDGNGHLHATDGETLFTLNDFAPWNASKSIWIFPPARIFASLQDSMNKFNTKTFKGRVLVQTNTSQNGQDRHLIWTTDGTNAGSVFISEMPDYTSDLFYGESKIYFTNSDAAHGNEIFTTDGIAGNLAFFADINPGTLGSSPEFLFKENGKIFLFAYDGSSSEKSLFVINDEAILPPPPLQGQCIGGDTIFAAGVSGPGYTYQWQVDMGNGYQNIINGQHYSGANADTLHVFAMPSDWYGYKYRCVVNGEQQSSPEYLIRFKNSWLGLISSAWENSLNWSCGTVPDQNTNVFLSTGTITITSNAICRSLILSPGVIIHANPGAHLTITH